MQPVKHGVQDHFKPASSELYNLLPKQYKVLQLIFQLYIIYKIIHTGLINIWARIEGGGAIEVLFYQMSNKVSNKK